MIRLLLFVAALTPAAAPASELSPGQRYLRMRAADAAGNVALASDELSALLARDPGNAALALRGYRQAVASGDKALAIRTAGVLRTRAALPPDAPLLLAVDAIDRRDWMEARAQVNAIEQGKLFAFLAPSLRAWIALGAGEGDPLALLEAGRAVPLAEAYIPTQRALLLFAMGRLDEGIAMVRSMRDGGPRLKLMAAAALARQHKAKEAADLLTGDDDVLAAARATVAAGGTLPIGVDGAAAGVGELLAQAALDLARQQLAPVGLVLARFATFAAPGNASAWIVAANLLGRVGKPDVALAALDHVGRDDPFAPAARTLRFALLIDTGDKAAALAEAQAGARDPAGGSLQWGRLGDIYLSLDRPADAAAAYAEAIERGPRTGDLWSLWLQRGAALEQAGDWPAARDALRRALALAPTEPVVLNHLGYAELSRRENVAEAAGLIADASRRRPDDAAITDSLGWARYVQGDLDRAVPLLEQAAGKEPGEPTINEHLGDAYWSAGRRREARYAWRAALVTAENKDADRIRAKLDTGLTVATQAP